MQSDLMCKEVMNLEGHVDIVTFNQISGWAFVDYKSVEVDFFLDGKLLASQECNLFRPDLLEKGIGTGHCGFSFLLADGVLNAGEHVIEVKYSGTDTHLIGSPAVIQVEHLENKEEGSDKSIRKEGHVEGVDFAQVSGWAFDNFENTKIDVFLDGQLLESKECDVFRQDLLESGFGNGCYGFSVSLPNDLFKWRDHIIEVKFSETEVQLIGSPIVLAAEALPEGVRLHGNYLMCINETEIETGRLAGWILNGENDAETVTVEISIGESVIEVICCEKNENSTLFAKSERHGFSYCIPGHFYDGVPHELSIRMVDSNENIVSDLIWSNPITLSLSTMGYFDSFSQGYVRGWAVDGNDIFQPALIDIYVDGTLYDQCAAKKMRGDLARKNIGTGAYGFELELPDFLFRKDKVKVQAFFSGTDVELKNSPKVIETEKRDCSLVMADMYYGRTSENIENVSIVIPVFNAYEEVRNCVQSVLEHSIRAAELIIVDDCSTEADLEKLWSSLKAYENVRVIRNEVNCGYTKSVNIGIHAAKSHDVILLNSDTIVGPRWDENLFRAAYTDGSTGTVTAISNNAGAFSVPDFGIENQSPVWLSRSNVIRSIFQHSEKLYPEVPTGNGFCMYVKRKLFETIGGFDEKLFPRGYGEENDFCMRAKNAGWKNIIDNKTFVYHIRNVSFGEEKQTLSANAMEVLNRKYCEFAVERGSLSGSILMKYMRYSVREIYKNGTVPKIRVLYVIGTVTGGTPQTNEDLMNAVKHQYYPYLLVSDSKKIEMYDCSGTEKKLLERHDLWEPVTITSTNHREYEWFVARILDKYSIELMHVRHLVWHSLSLPKIAKKLNIPVVFSFHDFYTICPSINLVTASENYCGGNCKYAEDNHGNEDEDYQGEEARKCNAPTWENYPQLKNNYVYNWRNNIGKTLVNCDAFITTSPSAQNMILKFYPQLSNSLFKIIPHGRDFKEKLFLTNNTPDLVKKVKILFPGNIGISKGAKLIQELIEHDKAGIFEFHFLGKTCQELEGVGIHHGTYKRSDVLKLIRKINPHFIGVFSICPETYCHTLTEAWAAGVPVVATSFGALGERITEYGGGWLLEDLTPAKVYERLVEISSNRSEYLDKCNDIIKWQTLYSKQHTVRRMGDEYMNIYKTVCDKQKMFSLDQGGRRKNIGLLVPGGAANNFPASTHVRVLEWLKHQEISRSVNYELIEDINLFLYSEDIKNIYDAIVVQRTGLNPKMIDLIVKKCKENNVMLVYEIDDDLLQVPVEKDPNNLYSVYSSGVKKMLTEADKVLVSTEVLAQKYKNFNDNIFVLPNRLSEETWFAPIMDTHTVEVVPRDCYKVLYMGSYTHEDDLNLLRALFGRLGKKAKLYVVGGTSSSASWYERIKIPNSAKEYPCFVQWFRQIATNFDIAIAPLEEKTFNHAKSPLKFLEYAAAGICGIYSNVLPYATAVQHGINGILTNNQEEDWLAAVEYCMQNKDQVQRIAQTAYDDVVKNGTISNLAKEYITLFQ